MSLYGESEQRRGEVIKAAAIEDLQRQVKARVIQPSLDIVPTETTRGVVLRLTDSARRRSFDSSLKFGAVQTDFTTGTTISVKSCDANGVTSGDAFDVYVYAGQGSADLTAVTVAGASATATCKLAAGKIIAYSYSGSDAYLVGDVMQVLKDWWPDADTGKLIYAIYWRVGLAVSSVSEVEGPDILTSKRIDCTTGQVSDGGLAAGGGSYT